jgi:hypothetical protein
MKTKVINKNILLCEAETQKELTLTFFRMQEFYESQNPKLYRKTFDAFDFLDAMMDKNGNINYFRDWDGFNVPETIFNAWLSSTAFQDRSTFEEDLIDVVFKKLKPEGRFYIIGVRKNDKNTLKHELSHALFYLNSEYKQAALQLNSDFLKEDSVIYKRLLRVLSKELKYSDDVLEDELVAWIATSSKEEIEETFDVDWIVVESVVKKYRKLFKKFAATCI